VKFQRSPTNNEGLGDATRRGGKRQNRIRTSPQMHGQSGPGICCSGSPKFRDILVQSISDFPFTLKHGCVVASTICFRQRTMVMVRTSPCVGAPVRCDLGGRADGGVGGFCALPDRGHVRRMKGRGGFCAGRVSQLSNCLKQNRPRRREEASRSLMSALRRSFVSAARVSVRSVAAASKVSAVHSSFTRGLVLRHTECLRRYRYLRRQVQIPFLRQPTRCSREVSSLVAGCIEAEGLGDPTKQGRSQGGGEVVEIKDGVGPPKSCPLVRV